jgi:hypothetical protein
MKRSVYKAPGGIIRVVLEADEVIRDIRITGDFFLFPEEAIEGLERALSGVPVEGPELLKTVKAFYEKNRVHSHGVEPEHIVEAIKRAHQG